MTTVPHVTVDQLIARYDLFLLDAYGVLVTTGGALPGAARFLQRLRAAGKPYLLVTNDASRSPETSLRRYRGFGLELELDGILTSGMLLADYYASAGLVGARTIVLGTGDSVDYVARAGGVPVAPNDDSASVVVVADDDGFRFLDTLNDVVSVLLRRLGRGASTQLVLPNPDLIYPRGPESFGITAGAIAVMLEAIVQLRDPARLQRFVALGKPNAAIFEAAARRHPGIDRRRVVMLGDQLGTDILGANRFGIDSVLVETGVAGRSERTEGATDEASQDFARPTFRLAGLD